MTAPLQQHVYCRAVRRAEEILGDTGRLARYLHVSMHDVSRWCSGGEMPPLHVFLKCVDLVLDYQRIKDRGTLK